MTKEEKLNEYTKKIEYCQSVISKYNEKIAEYNQLINDIAKPETVNPLKEMVDKYDYDGDGIVSVIDYNITLWAPLGILNDDPKYDAENKTYNGKSLDVDNDQSIKLLDSTLVLYNVGEGLKRYVDYGNSFNYYSDEPGAHQECADYIRSYYRKNNYTLPTLQQVKEHMAEFKANE